MQIKERVVGGVTILDLQGQIILDNGYQTLKEKVSALLEAGKINFILNVEAVPRVDSAGLSEFLRAHVESERLGGRVTLLNLAKSIADVLAITRLLSVLHTSESEADAVASYRVQTPEAGSTPADFTAELR